MSLLPAEALESKAKTWNLDVTSMEFANRMDEVDPLRSFRKKFYIPKKKALNYVDKAVLHDETEEDEECLYFSGHSLGLKPKIMDQVTEQILNNWAEKGFDSNFDGFISTAKSDQLSKGFLADLVGAKPNEVSIMNSLSVNLHLLLTTFYKPTNQKYKIVIEDHAFPTDTLAVESHLRFHGRCPKSDLILIKPRNGEHLINEDDLHNIIETEGDSIALILFPGIQYYTGQLFNIQKLTKLAHTKDIIVGIDLAHAAGNVKLNIHDWNVDFAVWCTYKYLNSGPGGVGCLFVHETLLQANKSNENFPMLKGWWGSIGTSDFLKESESEESAGKTTSDIFRLSTPHCMLNGMLWASLQVHAEATLDKLTTKQFLITGYLEYLINHCFKLNNNNNNNKLQPIVQIITPSNPAQRGTQISLMFTQNLQLVQEKLKKHGIVCDVRMPYVIRVAPVPMYNSYKDVHQFVHILMDVCQELFKF